MTKNMGTVDRVLRFAVAALILILFLTGKISGGLAIVLGVVAVAFIVTSFVGTCPLYLPMKLSTLRK